MIGAKADPRMPRRYESVTKFKLRISFSPMSIDATQFLADINSSSLSDALSQVIQLSRTSSNRGLENWARLELLGYFNTNSAMTDETIVPEYRTVAGQWFDEYRRPLVLDNASLGFVNEIRLRHGVAELEGLQSARNTLTARFPEFSELIRRELGVDVSLFCFSPHAVGAVIASIKTELHERLSHTIHELFPSPALATIHMADEILELRPNFYGVGLNLRALWRKLQSLRQPGQSTEAPENAKTDE